MGFIGNAPPYGENHDFGNLSKLSFLIGSCLELEMGGGYKDCTEEVLVAMGPSCLLSAVRTQGPTPVTVTEHQRAGVVLCPGIT